MGLRPTKADETAPSHAAPVPSRVASGEAGMDGLSPDKSSIASPLVVKEAVLINPGAAMTFNRAVARTVGKPNLNL
jgi:hypothetical protein